MNQRLGLLLILLAAAPGSAATGAAPPQSRIEQFSLNLPESSLSAGASWKTENMSSCRLTAGAVTLDVEANPALPVMILPEEAGDTLVLRCGGPYGTDAAAVTMPVPRIPAPSGPPVIRYFRPVNISYYVGSTSFTAEWETTGASLCEIEPGRLASIAVPPAGSMDLETAQDRTYRLYCRNPYGISEESFRIRVDDDRYTEGDSTDSSGGSCDDGSDPHRDRSPGYYVFSGCVETACSSERTTYPDSADSGGSCSEDEDTADASGGSCSDDDSSSDSGSCSESSGSAGSSTDSDSTDSGSSCSDSDSSSTDTDSSTSSCSSSDPGAGELDAAAGILASGGWPRLPPPVFPPPASGKKRLCLRRPGRTGTGLFPFFSAVLIPGALRFLRRNAYRLRNAA